MGWTLSTGKGHTEYAGECQGLDFKEVTLVASWWSLRIVKVSKREVTRVELSPWQQEDRGERYLEILGFAADSLCPDFLD